MATREEIREEQRSLNEANAGKVDADGNEFVPLVVDGIVGPLTRAARDFEPADPPGGPADPPGDGVTPEEKAAQIEADARIKAEQIRADSLAAERAARELADKARLEENV